MNMERFSGIRRVLQIRDPQRDLDEELDFHFEQTIAEFMDKGMTPSQAREEAHRRFGDERLYRRDIETLDRRAAAGRRWRERLAAFGDSLRYALRRIRRSPGFAAGVVLTFALGIGANATMFGIIDRLLLRPPAHVVDAERVSRLMVDRYVSFIGERVTSDVGSYPDYQAFQRGRAFSSVAGFWTRELTLGQGENARPADVTLATGEFFSLLGVRPAFGRFFGPAEDRKGTPPVAVISHGLWQREFAGEQSAIGKTLDFGFGPVTIVGVAPRGFTGVGLEAVDAWLPLHPALAQMGEEWWMEGEGNFFLRTVARLAPGISARQAEAEATVLHRQGRREQIEQGDYDAEATILAASLIAARGPNASSESRVAKWLAGISLIVLLIACANVTNLLLARAARQHGEIGIRLALGSSRGRLVGQVVTESLLLALFGGIAALLLAQWGGDFMRGILLPEVAWTDPAAGRRVGGFVLAVSLLAGVAAGLVPGVQTSRPDLAETLKSGSRSTSAPGSRTRAALTVLQAALSVVLLVGAGLFVRSLHQVQSMDLGLDPEGVLLVVPEFEQNVAKEQRTEFFLRATERLPALPGVQHATSSVGVPFRTARGYRVRVPGLDSIPNLPGGGPYVHVVGRDYFATLGLQMLRGRGFDDYQMGAPPVVVVSETMARLLWPGQDAVGKCMMRGSEDGSCTEVVGVVEDARRFQIIEDQAMEFYVPREQEYANEVPDAFLVRTRGGPERLIPAIQRELLALEPRLRFAKVQPLQELIDPQARSWKLGATLFSVFGLLALVVAGIGLYSVLAFGVAQRTFELGIRSALGASRARLLALVFGQAMRLAGVGVLLGLAAALLAAPRIAPLLFGISPHDPWTLGTVVLALLLTSMLAGSLPAWRAMRVDPSVALRAE